MKKMLVFLVIGAGLAVNSPIAEAQGLIGGIAGVVTGLAGGLPGLRARVRPRRSTGHKAPASNDVHAGMVLPARGIQYQDVPAQFHVDPANRYAVVDGHPVLVDADTHRVVEVLD